MRLFDTAELRQTCVAPKTFEVLSKQWRVTKIGSVTVGRITYLGQKTLLADFLHIPKLGQVQWCLFRHKISNASSASKV